MQTSEKRLPSFGDCSLFDVNVGGECELPFDLPVEHYLKEALLGMNGAPKGKDGPQSQGSVSWRRFRWNLEGEAAQSVCLTLAWIAMGVIFDTVSEEARAVFRAQLASDWFVFLREQGGKGSKERDRHTDMLLTVVAQAIYRLLVDAFPPEQDKLAQKAGVLVEKLGMLVHAEVFGFRPTTHTLQELRQKTFCKPVLDNPHLDILEARKLELRQKKLEEQQQKQQPLEFGALEVERALEEVQLEHVLQARESRQKDSGNTNTFGGGRSLGTGSFFGLQMPPLCPPHLSVDRYDDLGSRGEEMYLRHLEQLDPQAAGEARAKAVQDHEAVSGLGSGPGRRTSMATLRASQASAALQAEQATRRLRDELLVKQIIAPLPEELGRKPLGTNGISPLLTRLAPGVQVQAEAESLKLKMGPIRTPQLPRLSAASVVSNEVQAQAQRERPSGSRGTSRGQDLEGTVSFSSSQQFSQPPSRMKQQVVVKRMEQDLEAFQKRSFEHYKKDYDLLTGQKMFRLDKDKLAKEEKTYVKKLEGLVGSRSCPALKPLGPDGREISRSKSSKALATKHRGFASAGASQGSESAAHAVGKRPWNELTSVDWLTSRS